MFHLFFFLSFFILHHLTSLSSPPIRSSQLSTLSHLIHHGNKPKHIWTHLCILLHHNQATPLLYSSILPNKLSWMAEPIHTSKRKETQIQPNKPAGTHHSWNLLHHHSPKQPNYITSILTSQQNPNHFPIHLSWTQSPSLIKDHHLSNQPQRKPCTRLPYQYSTHTGPIFHLNLCFTPSQWSSVTHHHIQSTNQPAPTLITILTHSTKTWPAHILASNIINNFHSAFHVSDSSPPYTLQVG